MTVIVHTIHRSLVKIIHDAAESAFRGQGGRARFKKRPRPYGKHLENVIRAAEENKRLGLSTKAAREERMKLKRLPPQTQRDLKFSRRNGLGVSISLPKLKCLEAPCDE